MRFKHIHESSCGSHRKKKAKKSNESLQALAQHVKKGVPLCDSIFRYQSDAYFDTFRQAKQLRAMGGNIETLLVRVSEFFHSRTTPSADLVPRAVTEETQLIDFRTLDSASSCKRHSSCNWKKLCGVNMRQIKDIEFRKD